jgi:hypothetical protein
VSGGELFLARTPDAPEPFMHLPDRTSYLEAVRRLLELYADQQARPCPVP